MPRTVIPSGGRFGTFASAPNANLNPCFAASRSRSSPNVRTDLSGETQLAEGNQELGSGTSCKLDRAAKTIARSPAARQAHPADYIANTSWPRATDPRAVCDASNIVRRLPSMPTPAAGLLPRLGIGEHLHFDHSERVPSRITVMTLPKPVGVDAMKYRRDS